MCIDNPREGFSNIFDTHPSVEKRVEALVKFAGGHDPGPLELAPPEEQPQIEQQAGRDAGRSGPWGDSRRARAAIRARAPGREPAARHPALGPRTGPPAARGGRGEN